MISMMVKIFCEDECRKSEIESLGIGVGFYDSYENCFTKCICPKNVLPKLKKKFKFRLEDNSDGCWYA